MLYLLSAVFFLSVAYAASRTTPPAGALVVGKSGAKYKTIQSAVNALNTTSFVPQTIFIQPGNYTEQVYIPSLRSPLTIYGATNNTSKYASNAVTITSSLSQANTPGGNDKTATLRAWTS